MVFSVSHSRIKLCQNCGRQTEKFYIWALNEKEADIKKNQIVLSGGKLLCWDCFKHWLCQKQQEMAVLKKIKERQN